MSVHLDLLLERYRKGEDVRHLVVSDIVGRYRREGMLISQGGASFDGVLSAELTKALHAAETIERGAIERQNNAIRSALVRCLQLLGQPVSETWTTEELTDMVEKLEERHERR